MKHNRKWLNLIAGLCITLFSSLLFAASVASFPAAVQLVGKDDPVTTSNIFQKRPVFLLVSSHATADLIKAVPAAWLDQGITIPADQFVSVAAVSKAPWLVKKLFIGSGLSSLVEERTALVGKKISGINNSPVIVDLDGDMASALELDDLGKKGYAIFIINQAGEIKPLLREVLTDDSDADINAAAKKIVHAVKPHFGAQ